MARDVRCKGAPRLLRRFMPLSSWVGGGIRPQVAGAARFCRPGEPTTVSPGPARARRVPSGRRRSGGGSHRWADQLWGRREVGQAPCRHSLACARSRSGTDRAHAAGGASRTVEQRLSPQFAGVGAQCREAARERNGVERLQSSESGAKGASAVPRRWQQQLAGLRWRGPRRNTLCRLRRLAWLNALLKTGQPRAMIGKQAADSMPGFQASRVAASPAKTCPRSG